MPKVLLYTKYKDSMVIVDNVISNDESFNIDNYLNTEQKTWLNNETRVSLYDKNLNRYSLENDFFEQLYFKLKNTIEERFNIKAEINNYIFKKDSNLQYSIITEWEGKENKIQEYPLDNIYVNDKIFYYKRYISNPETIIKDIDSLNTQWQFYSVKESNKKPYKRNSYEFAEYKKIDINLIGNELQWCIEDYESKNNIKISRFTDLVATKSYPGKFFGNHVDSNGVGSDPHITIIVDLNDNYDGGELEFLDYDLKLKPFAGSVLIYPSTEPYYHTPNLITMGHKISCIMFGFINE